jgi:hypothetical protein
VCAGRLLSIFFEPITMKWSSDMHHAVQSSLQSRTVMSAFHNDISGFQPRTHAPANTCLKPDIYIYECDYYIYIYIYIYDNGNESTSCNFIHNQAVCFKVCFQVMFSRCLLLVIIKKYLGKLLETDLYILVRKNINFHFRCHIIHIRIMHLLGNSQYYLEKV